MITRRQIRYFLAIAEDGNIHRAARRIRVAQPALTRQIRALEDEIGALLFERTGKGVTLTAPGEHFRALCLRTEGEFDAGVTTTRAIARGEAGTLRIGFIEVSAWQGIVPESIVEFRAAWPDVALELRAMTSLDQVEALRGGRIDAGFLYNPPLDDPELKVRGVAHHRVLLAVPTTSPLARRERVALADLRDEPLISFRRAQSPSLHDQLHSALQRAGLAGNIDDAAENEAEMLALVNTGHGISFINENQRLRCPDTITFIEVDDLDVMLRLCAVTRSDRHAPPLAKFLASLDARIGDQPEPPDTTAKLA